MKHLILKLTGIALLSTLTMACSTGFKPIGADSSSGEPQTQAADATTTAVQNIYKDVLGRAPKTFELNTVVRAIKSEGYTIEMIRYGLSGSDEAIALINNMFAKYHNRAATEDELLDLHNKLGIDHSLVQIEALIKALTK